MNIYAVICAAGAGSRMGQNKALCKLSDHETFLESIVNSLHACSIGNIVVVTGAQDQIVRSVHHNLPVKWCYNERYQSTFMLESLTCGLQLVPEQAAVIHWPVDCLFIHPDDLKTLIHAPESPLAVLSWNHEPGHPLRIAPQTAEILRKNADKYSSLREFVESQKCLCIEAAHESLLNCNDPQTLDAFWKEKR